MYMYVHRPIFVRSCESCTLKCGLLPCMDVTNSTKQESFRRS